MILTEDDKKTIDPSEAIVALTPTGPSASGSSITTTTTTPSSSLALVNDSLNNAHRLVEIGDAPLGPPPEFTPYEAEHFEVGYSDVVSHDPHLNSDGSFFFLFQAYQ